MSTESQLQRLNKQMDDLVDRLDFYAQVLYDQGKALKMALSDSVQGLLDALTSEREELKAKFDALFATIADLAAQIAAGGDPALQAKIDELTAQRDELQAQLDSGSAAIEQATAEVQALSDTGDAPAPPGLSPEPGDPLGEEAETVQRPKRRFRFKAAFPWVEWR